jgi:hypothetical protein
MKRRIAIVLVFLPLLLCAAILGAFEGMLDCVDATCLEWRQR